MAFPQEQTRTPTSVGTIFIVLKDISGHKSARFVIEVEDQNGLTMRTLSGDLVPHLTQAQINGLLGLIADVRTQAEAEILP